MHRRITVVYFLNKNIGPSEYGQQTRSLTAAYELVQSGYTNISVLTGGYNGWVKEEKDIEYDE